MHGQIDVVLLTKRLVPGACGLPAAVPWCERNALDRLDSDIPFRTHGRERLEVGCVGFVAHLYVAVGQENRVEREALEAAEVHPRNRQSVACDADEAYEPFVAGLDGSFQSTSLAQGGLPLDHVDEVVQLEQIDLLDAQAIEGAADLLTRPDAVTLPGLRRQEDTVAVACEPGIESQLRIAVGRCSVDVVHPELQGGFEGSVGLHLGDIAERRGAEDRA